MSRRMFVATTVAVVCAVGAVTNANNTKSEGSGNAVLNVRVSDVVADYLKSESPAVSNAAGALVASADFQLPEFIANLRPAETHRTVVTRDPREISSAEMPLVPLPSPLWTGSVGLAGLGVVGMSKKIRRNLRCM